MSSLIAVPITRHAVLRTHRCFCGEVSRYVIPHTAYFYCAVHAQQTMIRYRRWFQSGGQTRYVAA